MSVKIAEIHAFIITGDTIDRGEIDRIFDEQVDSFRDLLNSGKPKTALGLLISFEAGLGKSASAAIRSRGRANIGFARLKGSEARGVGKECVSTCRSPRSPYNDKKTTKSEQRTEQ